MSYYYIKKILKQKVFFNNFTIKIASVYDYFITQTKSNRKSLKD